MNTFAGLMSACTDALCVRVGEAGRQSLDDTQGLVTRQRMRTLAVQQLAEAFAVQPFHADEQVLSIFVQRM